MKNVCLWIIATSLLFVGFYSNQWGVAEQKLFQGHQHDMESHVVGRLVQSRQDGISSHGGLAGMGSDGIIPYESRYKLTNFGYQFAAYRDGLAFKSFLAYQSQIGGQGILFSILDKHIRMRPSDKLELFRMLTSLSSAAALAFVILWFYRQFGLAVSLCVLISTVLSPWLAVFGRNLYWCMWAFYVPMIVCMYYLEYEKRAKGFKSICLGTIVFLGVFIKCFINGYDYITATLIMMIVPFVYYSYLDKWAIKTLVKKIIIVSSSTCLAISVSLAILCYQIYLYTGNFADGMSHILYSLGKRTHGAAMDYPAFYRPSLESNVISVVSKYLKGTFLDMNRYMPVHLEFFRLSYLYLIIIFLLVSAFLFLHKQPEVCVYRRQTIALIWATWFSVLAPLSWYVIFKSHSFVHTHINYIVWHMPFCIFGFALCGLCIKEMLLMCVNREKSQR